MNIGDTVCWIQVGRSSARQRKGIIQSISDDGLFVTVRSPRGTKDIVLDRRVVGTPAEVNRAMGNIVRSSIGKEPRDD